MAGEELFQPSVLFGDGIAFFGGGCEHFLQSEDFLLEGLDVHLLALAVGSVRC